MISPELQTAYEAVGNLNPQELEREIEKAEHWLVFLLSYRDSILYNGFDKEAGEKINNEMKGKIKKRGEIKGKVVAALKKLGRATKKQICNETGLQPNQVNSCIQSTDEIQQVTRGVWIYVENTKSSNRATRCSK